MILQYSVVRLRSRIILLVFDQYIHVRADQRPPKGLAVNLMSIDAQQFIESMPSARLALARPTCVHSIAAISVCSHSWQLGFWGYMVYDVRE